MCPDCEKLTQVMACGHINSEIMSVGIPAQSVCRACLREQKIKLDAQEHERQAVEQRDKEWQAAMAQACGAFAVVDRRSIKDSVVKYVKATVEDAVEQADAATVERCAKELVAGVFFGDLALKVCEEKAERLRALSPDPHYVEHERLEARLGEHKDFCVACGESLLGCVRNRCLQRQLDALDKPGGGAGET